MFRNNTLNTKRETTDIWIRNNPVLNDMELGVEIVLDIDRRPDHYNIKLGDGITPWNGLDYFYQNLDAEDTDEILDDFTINLATRKPVANRIPIYNDNNTLKSDSPIDDDDVVRKIDIATIIIDATDIPTAGKIAKYNEDDGLKSGKIPTENNDVVRFLEFNNEVSNINSKISTLNGAYYVLDSYNFGRTLDETNPDDILILNTYAIANTPDASSMADVYNDTVIVNEFDSVEYVYNKIALMWVKYPNGYLTIATNDHLGVVKGTQPPADQADESKDTYVQVLSDGAMKLVGDRLGTALVSGGSFQFDNDGNGFTNNYPPVGEEWIVGKWGNDIIYQKLFNVNNPTSYSSGMEDLGVVAPTGITKIVDYLYMIKSNYSSYKTSVFFNYKELRLGILNNGNFGGYVPSSMSYMVANTGILIVWYTKS